MKIDGTETDSTVAQDTCEGDRQNRREFFNGLGKWSMVVVAAMSFLRGSGAAALARHEESPRSEEEPERPAWTVSDHGPDKLMKIAKKPQPHKDYSKEPGSGEGGGYTKGYLKYAPSPHGDYAKRAIY